MALRAQPAEDDLDRSEPEPEVGALRHLELGEVGDEVPDAAAPLAHQVVMRVLDVGVEPGPARAHVERGDLAELGQVVQRLVHRLERDGLHLPHGQGVDRLGRRMGLVALEDAEDALPLGGDLAARRSGTAR